MIIGGFSLQNNTCCRYCKLNYFRLQKNLMDLVRISRLLDKEVISKLMNCNGNQFEITSFCELM